MASDLFSIGVSGLTAAQAALSTTSNNISNASTPGYTREVPILAPLPGQQTTYGYLGSGVHATTVQRQVSSYLNANVQSAQSVASQQTGYYQQVSQLSQTLASSSTDIGSSIQSFFSNVQQLASNPSTMATRQTLLSSAQVLTDQFQNVGGQISSLNAALNTQMQTDVSSINTLANQIATLNQSIRTIGQGGNAAPPNDLLDQRDAAVQNISKLVGVSVVAQSDGSYNVFIGNGQGLVVGNQASKLSTVPSSTDPSQMELAYTGPSGTQQISENAVTGGDLGALVSFRSQTLNPTSQQLGQLAVGFALSMNQQNSLGRDLSGAAGGKLFMVPQPVTTSNTLNTGNVSGLTATFVDAKQLRASDYQVSLDSAGAYHIVRSSDGSNGVDSSGAVLPSTTTYTAAQLTSPASVTVDGLAFSLTPPGAMNPGDSFLVKSGEGALNNIALAISDPSKIAASSGPVAVAPVSSNVGNSTLAVTGLTGSPSLASPITISFPSPTTYTITGAGGGNVSGAALAANGQITVNGITVTLSGAPVANDAFTLSANSTGVGDGQNAVAMGDLQTSSLLNGGTASFSGLYSAVIGSVGASAAQYKSTSASAQGVLNSASSAQQSVSGVNLDEEGANLLKYQQEYQACAKAIQIASTLFQSILQLQ